MLQAAIAAAPDYAEAFNNLGVLQREVGAIKASPCPTLGQQAKAQGTLIILFMTQSCRVRCRCHRRSSQLRRTARQPTTAWLLCSR